MSVDTCPECGHACGKVYLFPVAHPDNSDFAGWSKPNNYCVKWDDDEDAYIMYSH